MSVPERWLGHYTLFGEGGSRRVFVDALDAWVSRRAGLELAKAAGLPEGTVRAWLSDARTTANAEAWGAQAGLSATLALGSREFLQFTADLSTARRAGDWRAADALVGSMYSLPEIESEEEIT